MTAEADRAQKTLIDELLEEQQQMTVVERFARRHGRGGVPAQARYYRDLVPVSRPADGQQYGFAVDLDACTGCKACVSACHSMNGLEDEETWRGVGLLSDGAGVETAPYLQSITTACHHCVEPACLEGCPVMAYDKDPETGIVRHLDDQCIGCQYCVLKCPYDVPKYSAKKGIVRKCDMCSSRLAVGEAPACVQACPTEAIRIELIDKLEVSRAASAVGARLIPGAFASKYTKPATVYRSLRGVPASARPGDISHLQVEPAHWPLAAMLLLTQMGAGIFAMLAFIGLCRSRDFVAIKEVMSLAGFAAISTGLAASVLHLGRPLGAWRFFLGLKTSWMSREILAFGVFAGAAGLSTAANCAQRFGSLLPLHISEGLLVLSTAMTALIGMAGIACSGMIYIDTRRSFWTARLTFPRFFGTTALLGAMAGAVLAAWHGASARLDLLLITVAIVFRLALSIWEIASFKGALANAGDPNHRSSLIAWKLMRIWVFAQHECSAVSVLLAIAALSLVMRGESSEAAGVLMTGSFLACAAAQVIERLFYFTTVVAPRMPGGIA